MVTELRAAATAMIMAGLVGCSTIGGQSENDSRTVLLEELERFYANIPDNQYFIMPDHLSDRPAEQYKVVDLRSREDYALGHIEGATNIPYQQLMASIDRLPQDKHEPILLYCRYAKASVQGVMALRLLGYDNVYQIGGGLTAWQNKNKPTVVPEFSAGRGG